MIRPMPWAAGLFEGEGCITISKTGHTYLGLSTTDLDVMEDFRDTMGVGHLYTRTKMKMPHYKTRYMWRVYKIGDIEDVIRKLSPWLGDRRLVRAIEVLSQDRRKKWPRKQ